MGTPQKFPTASDTLLRAKDSDGSEIIIFPITRYGDVLNSPKVTSDIDSAHDAPFILLKENTEEVDEEELHELCNSII